MNYRVETSHCSDPYEVAERFEAKSDKAAKRHFRKTYFTKNYAWDDCILYRVDVVEKVTEIDNDARKHK
jgi:hypothetical protein